MPSTLMKATITEDFLAVCSVSNIVRVPVCVGKRTDERFGAPSVRGQILETSCKTFSLPSLGYRSRVHCSTLRLRLRQRLGAIHMHRRAASGGESARFVQPPLWARCRYSCQLDRRAVSDRVRVAVANMACDFPVQPVRHDAATGAWAGPRGVDPRLRPLGAGELVCATQPMACWRRC